MNTCLENRKATFVPTKMLLDRHEIVIKICNLCHKFVDLVVSFETSLGLKKIYHGSSSYDNFSEHMSRK